MTLREIFCLFSRGNAQREQERRLESDVLAGVQRSPGTSTCRIYRATDAESYTVIVFIRIAFKKYEIVSQEISPTQCKDCE